MKRPQAKAYFAKAIDDMYAELSASDASARKLLWICREKMNKDYQTITSYDNIYSL